MHRVPKRPIPARWFAMSHYLIVLALPSATHALPPTTAQLIPAGSVREKVMGNVRRPPTAAELKQMQGLAADAMQEGAWGMSTGLQYVPGAFAKTDEIIALAQVVAKHGGFYASHIRDE